MTSREFRSRLLARAGNDGLQISASALELLERYYQLLVQWNSKINLTGIQLDELTDHGIDRLFVEPLLAARHVSETATVWLDLGSGGGSPALPLKIVRPAARLTMIESKSRKAAFLQEAVRSLAIRDAVVDNAAFTEVASRPQSLSSADLVTVRALKLDRPLFDAAATFLRPGGRLFLLLAGATLRSVRDTRFRLCEVVSVARSHSSQLAILQRVISPVRETR